MKEEDRKLLAGSRGVLHALIAGSVRIVTQLASLPVKIQVARLRLRVTSFLSCILQQ